MPKVFIKTYGCQMNERDSEQVAQMFIEGGYTITPDETDADVILMNTCSIRELAEEKAIGKMGFLSKRKKHRPHVVYGMMGCMAQSKNKELFKQLPRLDVVIGTQKYHHVFRYVDNILQQRLEQRMDDLTQSLKGAHVCDIAEEDDSQNAIKDHTEDRGRASAFVSIMQGCDMKCAYCIVPYTRGEERSRPMEDIVEEIKGLTAQGVQEITLLGQIVNRYGKHMPKVDDKSAFVQLLEAVHAIDGVKRIRFMSPHPIGFQNDLIHAFTYLPKLCSQIHFPMQSGSNRILKLMRRPYKNELFIEICERLRAARPDVAISTDIIVGFPGETEQDYLETRKTMERIEFDNAFIFRYSPRRGTPAAQAEDQVPEPIKEERNQDLLGVVNEIVIRKNNALVGSIQEILVEGVSKNNEERLVGRTPQNKPVIIDNDPSLIGKIIPVKIKESTGFTLYGEVL